MDHRIRTGDWLAGPSHLCSCQEDCFFKIWLAAFASSTLFTPADMDFHNYRSLAKSLSALCLVPGGPCSEINQSDRAACKQMLLTEDGTTLWRHLHTLSRPSWMVPAPIMAHATREVRTILDLRCD